MLRRRDRHGQGRWSRPRVRRQQRPRDLRPV